MKIIGTGSALPSLTVTNRMLTEFLDTSDEWITTRTGIRQRQILSDEKLEDLATKAAVQALENAHLQAKDLDFIICSNVINEYVTPAMSCIVQGKIGASCPCIDLNGACAGFIYALDIAEAYFAKGAVNHVLVLCAEEPTRMVDWSERSTCVLFGDGAGAVVLSRGDNIKAIRVSTQSKSESLYEQRTLFRTPFEKNTPSNEALYADTALVMNGQDVFKMAVTASVNDINYVLDKGSLTCDEVDHYLLHQANVRIIESVRQYLKQDANKFPKNIDRCGNTSSASIPILLDELNREKALKTGDKIVLSAFGAGFTTGACLLYWS